MYSDQTQEDLLDAYVKVNYIDKLRIVDKETTDYYFIKSKNIVNYNIGIASKIGSADYPHIYYSPEEIFAGKISVLNIDFISGKGQGEALGAVRVKVASWYRALRLIAIIGFLSTLIYTGIKIILSANAKDKAKYKEWLVNWFIGVAILFSLHYIMAFTITIINSFNELLSNSMPILRVSAGNGYSSFYTNLIGLVRFCTQYDTLVVKIGYEAMYIMLVMYTLKFTFIYIKRVLIMAFLTLIAPIVALTYPIDKISDGEAQGFNMWLKEYIFNALLQPLHCILWYVLVGSSVRIAAANPLYAIAVLVFMSEAEKIFKKIFGFGKAKEGTVGGLSSTISGMALAKTLMNAGKNKQQSTGQRLNFPGATTKDIKESDVSAGITDSSIPSSSAPIQGSGGGGGGGAGAGVGNGIPSTTLPAGRPRLNGKIKPSPRHHGKATPIRQMAANMIGNSLPGRILKNVASKAANSKPARTIKGVSRKFANSGVGQTFKGVGTGIRDLANKDKVKNVRKGLAGGATAVGKAALRPIWDVDRSGLYNGKRLVRRVARGGARIALGVGVAAIQAGISLTDGKYSASEALLAFGAGSALGARMVDGTADTFMEGYNSSLDKNGQMKRYKEDFRNRQDVIDFCKENYGDNWKEYRERIIENYVPRGFTDLKEIKKCIKYSDTIAKEINEKRASYLNKEQLDTSLEYERDKQDVISMSISTEKKRRKNYKISTITYNTDRENQYISSVIEGKSDTDAQKEAAKIRNASSAIRQWDEITK